jgi:hypothetical protein
MKFKALKENLNKFMDIKVFIYAFLYYIFEECEIIFLIKNNCGGALAR